VAKSRLATGTLTLAVTIAALAAAAPAAAQQPILLSAEDAAKVDRAMRDKPFGACAGGTADEIVVCARRLAGHGQRMEFEREPGEIVRHINEPGYGMAALAADRCTRLCNVGVSVNVIAAARAVPTIVRHILGRD
jgi:hypothetical protein